MYERYITAKSRQFFAFNIWNIESAKAVLDAAAEQRQDVIIQTSMKAFSLIDKEELRFFATNYAGNRGIKAYLHLDHCKRMDYIEEALKYKWDSVMIDASEQCLDENIRITNEVCLLAKAKNVMVEAEVGQINGVEDDISATEVGIARIEDVEKFIKETDVDMLAVAVGTAHGLYKGMPHLHYDLIGEIQKKTDIPIVVHGGTGLTDGMFLKLLSYDNIKKVNISTDVKLAYRQGVQKAYQEGILEKDEFDPLKVTDYIHKEIKDMVMTKMELLKING